MNAPARREMLPIRRLLAGLVVAALVLSGCTSASGLRERRQEGGSAAPTRSGPDWRPCPEVADELVGRTAPQMRYDCARITVPMDWNATGGDVFEIALLRARSAQQRDRIGSLVVNPGGPGSSGVDMAVYLSFGAAAGGLPAAVTERFDIVGFDPRGVSRSSPVECVSDADLDASFGYDPDPASRAEFDRLLALYRRIGEGCGARYGDRLRFYATEQAARDMEAVRASLGDEKLTYLGYSYGTLLGAVYARLYPQRVRALVLDGAVDPRQGLVATLEGQARGFEGAFDRFVRWCTRSAARCPLAPDPRGTVISALDKARVSPVRGADGREATAGWIFYAIVSSLYSRQTWQALAEGIDGLTEGDPTGVFGLADAYTGRSPDGSYSNLFDANMAVSCADENERPSPAEVRRLQTRWRTTYPIFGPSLAVAALTCRYWPARPDPYPVGRAEGAPPILVVGTTGDPATPYENAPALAEVLGVGRLLTFDGEGHTAYPQARCVAGVVNAYLIDLVVPQEGLRCPAR